ncbi:MAG: hypothetical protein A2600_14190 [Candidatus Lambdaproteobacteria bacterium RIFOXYD1_FULL_56_27]|uniref:Metallo-beta-lactamase domain-containing protein n=1 Tax=Candidatus Lambdaproteobacteria bacterium RIFOXYD2_FULL_56_26 TaxID=1817773 RepID=A0A1F6GZM2_9PROT|nr:MAG: hypothetical protein A2426_06070 [Candidatus Lambdaproteobacteria bacterium RIFOXYC1_FULL_56_13]OGH03613.1 MAG: hypothetical protein A2557_13840 [Candidatus Lambdaproteobacteria bacterium RIFOXYD2_FULL_56_26]OGH06800.1 MAG: hypothetical protein A2600_14190 [Candidatus Lambdaproteobacteria bacterium RIFOXYD1_FULL_56_27]
MAPTYQVKIHKIPTPYLVGPVDIFELWGAGKHLLVDTGPPTKEARDYLSSQIDLASLDYLLLTHCHPDHYGQAQFIVEQSKAEVLMVKLDHELYRLFDQRMEFLGQEFKAMGFPLPWLLLFEATMPRFQGTIPFPKRAGLLEENGDLLARLGISYFLAPGHSQSDVIYLFDQKAITGDVLLRNIFSAPLLDMDLSLGQGRFSNYRAYCNTVGKLEVLKGRQVLPSHNDWIEGVEEQILFYCHKILHRARKLEPLLEQGLDLHQCLKSLFPGLISAPFKLYIKAGELCFLKDYLEDPQRLHEPLAQLGLLEALGING